MTARAEILDRIATALGRPPAARAADARDVSTGVTRRYRRAASAVPPDSSVARFAERVRDYGAGVSVVAPAGLAAAVAQACGPGSVLAAPGVDGDWLAALGAACSYDDPPRTVAELTAVDTAVTGCAVAVAETGTLVLDHGPGQGRRVLTLIPDRHVCVVGQWQIVAGVPDALAALDPRGVLTWISGPSATSDIELSRVVGVHGPRRLHVVVVVPD